MEVYYDSVTQKTTTRYFFAGGSYEVEEVDDGSTVTTKTKRYYSIAGMRVAMKDNAGEMYYFASDHLSSASLVMDSSGSVITNQRFMPFGEVRTDVGTLLVNYTEAGYTDLGFTGQRSYMGQSGSPGFGLIDYNARFYSPALGRFTQPDTINPDLLDPQESNRYSYVRNNPIIYNDPSGHVKCRILKNVSGVTEAQCEQWVSDALAVMDQTATGGQLADRFRELDGKKEVTIIVGSKKSSGAGSMYTSFNNIYIHPDAIKDSPTNNNASAWGKVAVFSHETGHLGRGWGRGPGSKVETELYYLQGIVTNELNVILESNGKVPIKPHNYSKIIQTYLDKTPNSNYWDLGAVEEFQKKVNGSKMYDGPIMDSNVFCNDCAPLVQTYGLKVGEWQTSNIDRVTNDLDPQ